MWVILFETAPTYIFSEVTALFNSALSSVANHETRALVMLQDEDCRLLAAIVLYSRRLVHSIRSTTPRIGSRNIKIKIGGGGLPRNQK